MGSAAELLSPAFFYLCKGVVVLRTTCSCNAGRPEQTQVCHGTKLTGFCTGVNVRFTACWAVLGNAASELLRACSSMSSHLSIRRIACPKCTSGTMLFRGWQSRTSPTTFGRPSVTSVAERFGPLSRSRENISRPFCLALPDTKTKSGDGEPQQHAHAV